MKPGQSIEVYAYCCRGAATAWSWFGGYEFVREDIGALIVRKGEGPELRCLSSDVRTIQT